MGRPLRARFRYPGHSAAHPLNQQGRVLPREHMFSVTAITGVGGAPAKHLLTHGREVRALVSNREKAAIWAPSPKTRKGRDCNLCRGPHQGGVAASGCGFRPNSIMPGNEPPSQVQTFTRVRCAASGRAARSVPRGAGALAPPRDIFPAERLPWLHLSEGPCSGI